MCVTVVARDFTRDSVLERGRALDASDATESD